MECVAALALSLVPHLSTAWSSFTRSTLRTLRAGGDSVQLPMSAAHAVKRFGLDPVTTAYIGCPECASLYDPASLQPSARCTYISVKTRAHCRKPLFDPLCTKPTRYWKFSRNQLFPGLGGSLIALGRRRYVNQMPTEWPTGLRMECPTFGIASWR